MSVLRTSSAPPGNPLLAAQKSILLGRYGASLRADFMYLHRAQDQCKPSENLPRDTGHANIDLRG